MNQAERFSVFIQGKKYMDAMVYFLYHKKQGFMRDELLDSLYVGFHDNSISTIAKSDYDELCRLFNDLNIPNYMKVNTI